MDENFKRLSIEKYNERQELLEEIAASLKYQDEEKLARESLETFSVLSSHSVPYSKSISQTIAELKQYTKDQKKKSKEIDEKLEKIHETIENFDNFNLKIEPESSNFEAGDTKSIVIENRVHQIKIEDSESSHEDNAELWIPYSTAKKIQPPVIKETKASKLKTNFLKNKFFDEQNSKMKSQISKSSLNSMKKAVNKAEKPKVAKKVQDVNFSIKKILDAAKKKHKSNYLQNNIKTIPINVQTLQLD